MAVKETNTRISVKMPKCTYDKLLKLAESDDRSMSNLILKIINDYLKEKEDI